MVAEGRGVENLDILEKTHNKAADTLIVADLGVEKPMTIVQRPKVPLSKRVLLDKQVARKHTET